MRKIYLLMISIIAVSMTFTSCKKDEEPEGPSTEKDLLVGYWESATIGSELKGYVNRTKDGTYFAAMLVDNIPTIYKGIYDLNGLVLLYKQLGVSIDGGKTFSLTSDVLRGELLWDLGTIANSSYSWTGARYSVDAQGKETEIEKLNKRDVRMEGYDETSVMYGTWHCEDLEDATTSFNATFDEGGTVIARGLFKGIEAIMSGTWSSKHCVFSINWTNATIKGFSVAIPKVNLRAIANWDSGTTIPYTECTLFGASYNVDEQGAETIDMKAKYRLNRVIQ